MARSKREVPHVYLSTTIDLTLTLTGLTAENGRRSVAERLLPAVLFIKAFSRACAEVPDVNGLGLASADTMLGGTSGRAPRVS
jgi:pyruvate dehydrogenase E2 component (dihydrolipoamide acetyltransferase)